MTKCGWDCAQCKIKTPYGTIALWCVSLILSVPLFLFLVIYAFVKWCFEKITLWGFILVFAWFLAGIILIGVWTIPFWEVRHSEKQENGFYIVK